jgi:hypothetical protein
MKIAALPQHPAGMHDAGMSDQVELRPAREDDLAMLEALTQDPRTTDEFE